MVGWKCEGKVEVCWCEGWGMGWICDRVRTALGVHGYCMMSKELILWLSAILSSVLQFMPQPGCTRL